MWLIVLAAAWGCETRSPAGPGDRGTPDLSGTWSGSVTDSYGGDGTLSLTFVQQQFGLSGSFRFTFADPAKDRSGYLTGNTEAPALAPRLQLAASSGFDCPPGTPADSFFQVTWVQAGDRLQGEYSGFSCVGTVTGGFDVTRR